MRDRFWPRGNDVFLVGLLLIAGCSENAAPPEALSQEEVPATVQKAFEKAPSEMKTVADQVVSALQRKDDARAFVELQSLSARGDLSPAQRTAAARSLVSVSQKLQAAAAAGDERAKEMLEMHRAHK